jgi:DNA-binding transcriptional ArsR family regulator
MGTRAVSDVLQEEAAVRNPKREELKAFLASRRHIARIPPRGPLSLSELARAIGVSRNTTRRWLKADHPRLYWDHWASLPERWENAQAARRALPAHVRKGREAEKARRTEVLLAALNEELAQLEASAGA